MDNKNLHHTDEFKDEWNENDLLNDDMFSLSNMSNMISMASNPNMYMAGTPTLNNMNSDEPLQKSSEDNKSSNKK